jgi:hypothetical protein
LGDGVGRALEVSGIDSIRATTPPQDAPLEVSGIDSIRATTPPQDAMLAADRFGA